MKRSLYIIKKLIRKLYHLIWFLSLFIFFSPIVNAVNGEIPASIRSSEISQSSQAQCYNSSHNSINTSFVSNVGYATYYQCSLNSTNGYLSFNVNHALVTDTLYQITLYIGNQGNQPMGHGVTNISVGTGVTDANSNNSQSLQRATVWNFADTWNIDTIIDVSNGQVDVPPASSTVHLYFITFTVPTDGKAFLNVPIQFGSSTNNVYYYGYNLQVIGHLSNNLTSSDVQSVINSSGLATARSVQDVQSSVNQVRQDLSNLEESERQNAEDIMDNQNSNTDKQIESQKVCKTINIDKNSSGVTGYLNSSGNVADNNQYITTTFVTLGSNSKIEVLNTYTENDYRRLCFYNNNKTNISCIVANTLTDGQQVAIPDNASFVRFTVRKTDNLPTYKVLSCENGNQALNDSINGLNDSITNDDAPSIDLSDIQTSDTPISDLITLPLTLLNSIYNGISGSCSNWNLLLPFNHSISLRCFTISDYVGSNVATIIDTAICLFMSYRIILLFIAVFNDITTLSDTYTNYVKRGRY